MCRDSSHDCIWRYIFRDDGSCSNYCTIADMHSGQDNGFIADPYIIANDNITFVVPSRCDIGLLQIPLFVKRGNVYVDNDRNE